MRVELRGAEGQVVEWIRNGEPFAREPVEARGLRRMVEARDGDWFSVIVRDPTGQATVLSNAIYVRSR